MPADVGRGSSNGRFNRCSCAIASFSCSVYAGRSTTCRQSPHLRGNRPGVGRRRDPQNPGEIKRDSEVHVHERRALRRVEDAEQRVGILVSVACLVDPLEDEDRVVHLGVAQAVDHAAGGAAIRPHNLMLGRLAVEGHAHGLPAEGLRDRVRERCLAGPPGTGKAEDRGPSPSPSRANDEGGQGVRLRATARARPLEGEQVARLGTRPQELKDAGLDAVEGGVGAAQNLRDVFRVEPLGLGLSSTAGRAAPEPDQAPPGPPRLPDPTRGPLRRTAPREQHWAYRHDRAP